MIDLRSDTLTLPNQEMLQTILSASLGDDGRTSESGRGEDPTVNALEDYAAEILHKDSAVFFSSGTLANTSAVLTHSKPGEKVLIEPLLHICKSEKVVFSQRVGQLHQVEYDVSDAGKPSLASIERQLKKNKLSLLIIENTHNFRGGICLGADEIDNICNLAHHFGVPVHMDGARIFNASAFLGTPASRLCEQTDSVMLCLSKGLGAPIGSLVAGSAQFTAELRKTRKLLGGMMRQAGILAAPGLYALKHNREQINYDNIHAVTFANRLKGLSRLFVNRPVETNIVMINTENSGITAEQLCELAYGRGLFIRPMMKDIARAVFYSAINADDAEQASEIVMDIDRLLMRR